MKNKEWTEEICKTIGTYGYKELIERALDEKDVEWKKHSELRDLLGFQKGQREMRERVERLTLEEQISDRVVAKIRALPIEGE